MSNRAQFMTAVLQGLGAPVTTDNVDALVAQSVFEFGTQNPVTCHYNPLATTLQTPGAVSDCNSVGVKNYRDFQAGVDATVQTYRINAYGYPAVVAALRANAGAGAVVAAISASQWGSKPTAAHLQTVAARRDFYYGLTLDGVPGPVGPPAPTPLPKPATPPTMMETTDVWIAHLKTPATDAWYLMDPFGVIRQFHGPPGVFGIPQDVLDLRGDPPQLAVITIGQSEFDGFNSRASLLIKAAEANDGVAALTPQLTALKGELDALKAEAEAGYPTLTAIATKVGAAVPGASVP